MTTGVKKHLVTKGVKTPVKKGVKTPVKMGVKTPGKRKGVKTPKVPSNDGQNT